MSYYLRTNRDGLPLGTWKIDDDTAVQLGVSNPEGGPGTYFKAEAGETIWDTIRRQTPWLDPNSGTPFHPIKLEPGQFYPRMARPIDADPKDSGLSPGALKEANIVAIARGQLTVLTRQLDRICQTVQPNLKNFDTYGHDIRNLLILACTEVETHWRGVLAANGVRKQRYSTNDYVTLQPAMKLDEYALAFPNYPWLTSICPYRGWGSTGKPTQELEWYDAYNAVKHDRESAFERGTLRHTFEAISASLIIMVAQFGLRAVLGWHTELDAFYQFASLPAWSPSDVYIMPWTPEGHLLVDWTPIDFDFSPASH